MAAQHATLGTINDTSMHGLDSLAVGLTSEYFNKHVSLDHRHDHHEQPQEVAYLASLHAVVVLGIRISQRRTGFPLQRVCRNGNGADIFIACGPCALGYNVGKSANL